MNIDSCPGEIDFYTLRSLRNDALNNKEGIIRDVKRALDADDVSIEKSIERVNKIISRYTAVTDPMVDELIPFYAFINVRENFKAVTEVIGNLKKVAMREMVIGIYDLIGKPDFLIVGLTQGARGKQAERFIHDSLTEVGGEGIHNYLTIQVEVPRAIKKFWHCKFDLEDIDERLKKLQEAKYDRQTLKELQNDCRSKRSSEVKLLEKSGIIKGYSVVMDADKYQSGHLNFIKAFIQVDALYDRFSDLYNLLEEGYSEDIRGMIEIPYNRYGILVECECVGIARLGEIMSTIRNCEYVRTTRTAIARNIVREELWVI